MALYKDFGNESKMDLRIAGRNDELFQVHRFSGSEGISQLFRFEIDLVSTGRGLLPAEITGQPAVLVLRGAPGVTRCFHGLISRFETVGEGPDISHYRAELVPALWLLTHRYFSKIFQDKTIPQILSEVLIEAGIPADRFEMKINAAHHPKRNYCVQYRETDFHFISRLMEEEGIYYFFDHTADDCQLIIADSARAHRPIDGADEVPFVPPSNLVATEEHITRFRFGQEVRTGAVTLRDYDYEQPSCSLHREHNMERDAKLEFSDYPGNYHAPDAKEDSVASARSDHGKRVAKWRAEEFECRRRVGCGAGTIARLKPGRLFKLTSHPADNLNQAYLLTKVMYQGKQAVTRSVSESASSMTIDSRLNQALTAAKRISDPAVKELAEAVLQLAGRLQPTSSSEAEGFPGRFVYHQGRVACDPVGNASAGACDPMELLPGQHTGAGRNGRHPAALNHDAATFECRFECIPEEVTFRPQRITPWPVIKGCQTAVVVGKSGDEIYTDKQGRVKVQFYWDRIGKNNERSSLWIRVSQPWAGAGYGGLVVPRVGQEVIVEFMEGDPDRPIITGRVYNEERLSPQSMPAPTRMTGKGPEPIAAMQGRPQELPATATRTSIRSNSTPGGGGANEITIDDAAGSELMYLNATKDGVRTVGNDDTTTVANDRKLSVGNDLNQFVGNCHDKHIGVNETLHVGVNQTENVGVNRMTTIGVNDTETIGANKTVTIGANHTETVAIAKAETIGAAKALTIGAAYAVSVGAAMMETVGAYRIETVGSHKKIQIGADMDQTVAGKQVEKADEITLMGAKKITLNVGASSIVLEPAMITIKAPLVKINC